MASKLTKAVEAVEDQAGADAEIQVGKDFTLWDKLMAKVRGSDKVYARVGVLASKGGSDKVDGSDITLVELAAIHEFGSPAANIPERSFIRRTFEEKEDKLRDVVTKLSKAVVTSSMSVEKAVGLLGQWAAAEIKKTITSGPHIPPPLSPITIARKGSDRPLVDTGRLVGSITYEVVGGGKDPA